MMLNYCSDTLSLKNRIDFPRTFRIKKRKRHIDWDISLSYFLFLRALLLDYQFLRRIAEHDGIDSLRQLAYLYS